MKVDEAIRRLREDHDHVAAWEVLASEAYQPLLAYAAALLLTFRVAPGYTAYDIVHDVLIAFYERWNLIKYKIDSVNDLHAYLRRSCRNLLIDRYRHNRRAEKLVDFLTPKPAAPVTDQTELDRSILTEEIVSLLQAEQGVCAELFRKYLEEDLSPAELAEQAGASPATFYSRWHRCLKKAQEIFRHKKGGLGRL